MLFCMQLMRQHWSEFCQMKAVRMALGPDQSDESYIRAAEDLMKLAVDVYEVLSSSQSAGIVNIASSHTLC